jgi:hypothetical protein
MVRAIRVLLRLSLVVMTLVGPASSRWSSAAEPEPPAPESPQRSLAFDTLIAKAQTSRSLPVIIAVKAAFTPEGQLASAQAAQTQRAAIAQAQAEVERVLGKSTRKFEYVPYLSTRVDVVELQALRASPWVIGIAEDVPEPPALAESTALIGVSTPGTGVWARGYTGAGWVVAILDTGVQTSHPFLSGKVVAEACFSNANGAGSSSGGSSVCPNGQNTMTGSGSGVNCPLSVNGCAHGTHVAGIAAGREYAGMAAETGSGQTFSGVAREAQVIAIQVFTRFNNSLCVAMPAPCALTFPSDQVAALDFVYGLRTTFNIAAANMSLGGGKYTGTCDFADTSGGSDTGRTTAIQQLRSVNIATVVATGNNGYTDGISAPACISAAVSVGATNDGSGGALPVDTVATFSNSASFLKLLAPGAMIESSVAGGGYAQYLGTSMATPHVSGAWAALRQAVPSASVDTILQTLQDTGLPVNDTRNGVTKSRIRVDEALNALLPPPLPPVCQTRLTNGDFESGAAPWVQAVLPVNPGFAPIRSGSVAGQYQPAGPHAGNGWAWFGGGITSTLAVTRTTQIISQPVNIPVGTASLEFGLWISRADAGTGPDDKFQALINTTPLFSASGLDYPAYAAGYRTVRVDVGAFATGITHTLTFSATTVTANITPPIINFNVDEVGLCSPAFYPVYLPLVSR